MKKLIQICSFLTLVFVFSAVSASAQAEYGSQVEIPFAFTVGDRTYDAGKYIVKLSKFDSGSAAIVITSAENDSVQTVLAKRNGVTPDGSIRLVFDKVNGDRFLSQVVTPGGGFAVLNRTKRNMAAAKQGSKAETATTSDLF